MAFWCYECALCLSWALACTYIRTLNICSATWTDSNQRPEMINSQRDARTFAPLWSWGSSLGSECMCASFSSLSSLSIRRSRPSYWDFRAFILTSSSSLLCFSSSISWLSFSLAPARLQIQLTLKVTHREGSSFSSTLSEFLQYSNLPFSWLILVLAPKNTFLVFSSFSAICCLSCSSLFLPSDNCRRKNNTPL